MKISFFKIISISLILFTVVVFFLALNSDKRYTTEKIVGKNLDNFEINFLLNDEVFKKDNLTDDKYHLVNIWASWCVPCRSEHEILMLLSKTKGLDLYGINYKDDKKNAIKFIEELGNPFKKIGTDNNGRSSMVWGVYGVPETFIIHNGTVIYKHIGPIHMNELEEIVLPILGKLL